jgi:hypothetical protein
MGIVNAKLLADNLKRINDLNKVGLSDETIASAARDKTGDSSITAQDIDSFKKIGNISSKKMLISANQGKKLTQFAQAADATAASVVDDAKKTSKNSETTDTNI